MAGTIMQTNEIMDQLCPEISPRTPICTGFATHLIALLMTPAPAGRGLLPVLLILRRSTVLSHTSTTE